MTVATPAPQWAYALSCALPPRVIAADGSVTEGLRCTFDISVSQGRIGVGWTSLDGTSFVIERFTSRTECRISFVLQPGDQVGRLVFRNVDPSGQPSEFIVHTARVEPVSAAERRYPVVVAAREFASLTVERITRRRATRDRSRSAPIPIDPLEGWRI